MNETAKSNRSLRVFLCHSSGDKDAVRKLCERLRNSGFKPWLDEDDLLPGEEWETAISEAVRDSDVVLVCLSRASITKTGFVQKEIKFALDVADQQPEHTIYLIPTRLEECEVPQRLSRWHWVDLYKNTGYDKLVLALQRRAEALRPAPNNAPEYNPLADVSNRLADPLPAGASSSAEHNIPTDLIKSGEANTTAPPVNKEAGQSWKSTWKTFFLSYLFFKTSDGLSRVSIKRKIFLILVAILVAALLLWQILRPISKDSDRGSGNVMQPSELAYKIQRFVRTEIVEDTSHLSEGDRKALSKIIEAAKLMDSIFYQQVWSGNSELKKKLEADTSSEGKQRLHYFIINKGPWSRLDNNEPFIEGVPHEKPKQAGFYPDGITNAEFNAWMRGLSEADLKKAFGFYFVIRRGADGKLKTVPYSQEYREFLEPAARLLREAAGLTTDETLKNFLTKRADAFMSDDYYASDVAWMDLNGLIELTIGPCETYEDELYGYKASFESFVTLRDDAESAKLAKFSNFLQELENNLPIDARYRNPRLGAASPIRVVNVVFASGEGNRGVQTAAFNLPNDEQVVKEKGSKRVIIRNMQEAKFNKVLVPISAIVVDRSQRTRIYFDDFFTFTLAHELMHGLGPHSITVGGRETSTRMELKELYSAIEEAKADILGLWALQYLIDNGAVEQAMERDLYTTYLASAFRSVRFGISEAHGAGQALQFNYLLDEGAIEFHEGADTFSINYSRIKDATRKLANALLMIEAEGSYKKAKTMLDKYALIRLEMQKALDKLKDVPVDIEPHFKIADGLENQN